MGIPVTFEMKSTWFVSTRLQSLLFGKIATPGSSRIHWHFRTHCGQHGQPLPPLPGVKCFSIWLEGRPLGQEVGYVGL